MFARAVGPKTKSVVKRRSHCRSCGRTLAWWENIPVLSWLVLRGRCRTCKASDWLALPAGGNCCGRVVGLLCLADFAAAPELASGTLDYLAWFALATGGARIIFLWLLVGLAVLDAENFWLPDRLTIPGIFLGLVLATTRSSLTAFMQFGGDVSIPQAHGRAGSRSNSGFSAQSFPAGRSWSSDGCIRCSAARRALDWAT